MDEEPPKCFFGWSDVQSWAYYISLINIFLCSAVLIAIFCGVYFTTIDRAPWICIGRAISAILLLSANVSLLFGVLKRNTILILNWLKIYLVWFISITIKLISFMMILAFFASDSIEPVKWKIMIDDLLFCGIAIICYYTVYRYYNFEKMRSS